MSNVKTIYPPLRLREYRTAEMIGFGSYGRVYKAYHKNGPHSVAAIKAVIKSRLSSKEIDHLISEISLLKTLKHEHIVKMINFEWDTSYIYIIMEYCGRGDLSKVLQAHSKLPEVTVQSYLIQIASALEYLAAEGISHMDLKPKNILITTNKKVKLGDFGFATHYNEFQSLDSDPIGSPLYMAPEIFLEGKNSPKADLWSLGVILYECLYGTAPYKSESMRELLQKIKDPTSISFPSLPIISFEAFDVLSRLLDRDPDTRIEFDEFFNHDFLRSPYENRDDRAFFQKALWLENKDRKEEALSQYQKGLQILIEKKANGKYVSYYMTRAEECQRYIMNLRSKGVVEEVLKTYSRDSNVSQGLNYCLEGEIFEKELKLKEALVNYEMGLGIIIPFLVKEPKSANKTQLQVIVSRWMTKAEVLKETISVQSEKASNSKSDCLVQ